MEATAHFEHGFCCLLNLPSATEEEQYLIHLKHVQVFFKGIKLNFTLLLKKKKKKGSPVEFKEHESLEKIKLVDKGLKIVPDFWFIQGDYCLHLDTTPVKWEHGELIVVQG